MDWQLLILTYPPDLNWLDVCLRSVKKYVDLVHRPLVIATPECQGVMPESSAGCEIVFEPQNADHHRGQVYIKMNADKYIESELVFITDSDCLFTRKCSVDDFCHDGKPIVNMEAYSDLIPRSKWEDQNCFYRYKTAIANTLKLLTEYEYMRQHPFLFYRDHIRDCREKIESVCNKPLLEVMQEYDSGYFSEFNLFAAYCRDKHPDMYHWQHWTLAYPLIIRQFHSHSESPYAGNAAAEVARILA